MSNLVDLAPLLARGGVLQVGSVVELRDDGTVRVAFGGCEARPGALVAECHVLNPDGAGSMLGLGDTVLVWPGDAPGLPGERGVVLGCIGPHAGTSAAVADPRRFAERPASLVIETQGELVLRNAQARIRLGADGEVEISCTSFAARSRRLLRLLAPLIKLN
jgi:hypothetical protein